ncbi:MULTISPECIES: hypothetical protein [Streptomyces]|nr:hypothetical protein [Streptomyces sp. CBMAI 2042]RLV70291.1 hypothetical protein STAN_5819 [Streptomyces sp. CBMAI 2042]
MRTLLHKAWNLLRDIAYGVNAGHAIRLGLKAPVGRRCETSS